MKSVLWRTVLSRVLRMGEVGGREVLHCFRGERVIDGELLAEREYMAKYIHFGWETK